MRLRRPSARTLLIGGVSLFAGFALAASLAIPLVLHYGRAAMDNVVGRTIIDPLLGSAQLLRGADHDPDHVLRMIRTQAIAHSFAAATQFDGLSDANRRIVLSHPSSAVRAEDFARWLLGTSTKSTG